MAEVQRKFMLQMQANNKITSCLCKQIASKERSWNKKRPRKNEKRASLLHVAKSRRQMSHACLARLTNVATTTLSRRQPG